MSHLPVIAIVGRPNVGKSTLFNRVIGRRAAIVHDRPGVTRDRNFGRAEWSGRNFLLVDTGGVVEESREPMDRAVRAQALTAVAEADLILFLVDGRDGVHPLDQKLAEVLRKADKPVVLVANKMDNLPDDLGRHDFWELGMGEPLPVSAISGKGSGDLLDRVIETLPERPPEEPEEGEVRVAVVGKPNVGKSSFVNRLFGEDRVVVSESPGTTRDAVDSPMRYHGRLLIFADTAGLRRHARVRDDLEYYSALRTERVVREADVCVVLVDATEELHAQDIRIIEAAWEAGAGVILVANKWDLVEKDTLTSAAFEKKIRARVPFLRWVPVRFVSALTGQRVRSCLDLILKVQEERGKRVETHEVNETLARLVAHSAPPHFRGRPVKIRYGTQVSTSPPTFALFVNFPKGVPTHYIRYLHNGFREQWPFMGTALRLRVRSSRDS